MSAQLDCSPQIVNAQLAQTFTVTLTGATATTGTATYVKVGRMVILMLPVLSGAAIALNTTAGFSGIPVEIRPGAGQTLGLLAVKNNSITLPGQVVINTDGTATLGFFATFGAAVTTVFTALGNKGISAQTVTYLI